MSFSGAWEENCDFYPNWELLTVELLTVLGFPPSKFVFLQLKLVFVPHLHSVNFSDRKINCRK